MYFVSLVAWMVFWNGVKKFCGENSIAAFVIQCVIVHAVVQSNMEITEIKVQVETVNSSVLQAVEELIAETCSWMLSHF